MHFEIRVNTNMLRSVTVCIAAENLCIPAHDRLVQNDVDSIIRDSSVAISLNPEYGYDFSVRANVTAE